MLLSLCLKEEIILPKSSSGSSSVLHSAPVHSLVPRHLQRSKSSSPDKFPASSILAPRSLGLIHKRTLLTFHHLPHPRTHTILLDHNQLTGSSSAFPLSGSTIFPPGGSSTHSLWFQHLRFMTSQGESRRGERVVGRVQS
ncbi:hypothetical protein AMECASPLE_013433 [Ameca splendens]|uniref:Uncharacterized protein n=1 Tax=Ameca splendens TaxID=208324 RepID=A0ABV0YCF8_9TELE